MRRRLLGVVALAGLVVETFLLQGRLQWLDVYMSTASLGLRTGSMATLVLAFTDAAPFIGASLVLAGIVVALRGGRGPQEITAILVQLAAGLLIAWVFKVIFERARPGEVPWNPSGESFPSGHVTNAIICVGTSVRLLRPRGSDLAPGRLARLLVVVGGLAFVPAVALSRIVLARHWMTDVIGSLLLGSALLALAPTTRPTTTLRLVFVMPFVLLGALATSATGNRIRLPSPSTPSAAGASMFQANEDFLGAMELDYASAPSEEPSERFTLLTPTYGKQRVDVHEGRGIILKLLARPHFDLTGLASRRLELVVDGAVIGKQPLGVGWRMLAFALPTLTPGTHEFELRPRRDW